MVPDNNDNSDDNVRFSMTKTIITMVMEELVTVIIVTLIRMSYRWNDIEK